MALKAYGVLKGKAIGVMIGGGSSPHYQVHIVDDTTDYRIAVNVKSQLSPSELEYLVVDNFSHPILALLPQLQPGYTAITSQPGGGALDYIRGNLFDRSLMRPLAHNVPGVDNDLNEKIDGVMQRAMADETSMVYAFGERWGPEQGKKDKYFGFLPGNGIHDIHMNQSNVGSFVGDDGVWQDGGLLIEFPDQGQWIAVFLKFQSQGWHTDDTTGHKIGTAVPPGAVPPAVVPPPGPQEPPVLPPGDDPQGTVRILAALVNSTQSPEIELVTLLNVTPQAIQLDGWMLLDGQKRRLPLSGSIGPGEAKVVRAAAPIALSNKGGLITVLDAAGLKVDGVAYTKEQARHPGWTIVF